MKQYEWYDEKFGDYCHTVGFLAVMWAAIEFSLDQAIWELANVEMGAGACLTAQMIGPAPRLRALTALADYRGADAAKLKILSKYGNKIKSLAAKRNRFVHDSITIGTDTGIIRRTEITADHKLSFQPVVADILKMQALGAEIRDANVEFDEIKRVLFASLPAWTRTQFEESPSGIRLLGPKASQDQNP